MSFVLSGILLAFSSFDVSEICFIISSYLLSTLPNLHSILSTLRKIRIPQSQIAAPSETNITKPKSLKKDTKNNKKNDKKNNAHKFYSNFKSLNNTKNLNTVKCF